MASARMAADLLADGAARVRLEHVGRELDELEEALASLDAVYTHAVRVPRRMVDDHVAELRAIVNGKRRQ